MAKSRGQEFEDEFRASIPDGVFVKKLHTPAPPASQVDLIVEHLRRTRPRPPSGGDDWMVKLVSRSTHTPRQGFDMITAPAVDAVPRPSRDSFPETSIADALALRACGERAYGAPFHDAAGIPFYLHAKTHIIMCLELKSTTGQSFPFSRLKEHQEDALREEALAGRVAGLVVEFAEVFGPLPGRRELVLSEVLSGDVLFLPILSYLAYKRDAGRASLPYGVAERIGMRIEIDATRGRSRRYYKVGAFLAAFGADIPETEPRQAGQARGALPKRGGPPCPA